MQTDLFQRMEEFFRGRPELVNTPAYGNFSPAKSSTFEFVEQEGWEKVSKKNKAFEISPEHMIGYPEAREKAMLALEDVAKECAAKLYGFDVANIEFEKAYLMVNGSSLPIKVDVTLINSEAEGIRKTMYVKQFDPARLLGIELYSLVGGIDEGYNFLFNRGIIVEDALEGKHEFDLKGPLTPNKTYEIERIKSDVVAFYMGLDDLSKKDNYLITPDGRIKIIDFDVLDREYTDIERRFIQIQTCNELGISIDEYDVVFEGQERLLGEMVLQERDKIYGLIKILDNSKDERIVRMGKYIRKNTDRLLEKYHQV